MLLTLTRLSYSTTLSVKKTCHIIFVHYFGKCWAISKILSRLYSARNLQRCWYSFPLHLKCVTLLPWEM